MGDVVQFPTHRAKLVGLAARERDTRSAYVHALRARNRAIVEAVDEGYPQKRVAEACGLKPPSITRILSLPSYDEDTFGDAA